MTDDKLEKLLNTEMNVKMDGCAILIILRILTNAMADDEEIGQVLDSFSMTEDDVDGLSVNGKMLVSASTYMAVAAQKTFGAEFVNNLYGFNAPSGIQ